MDVGQRIRRDVKLFADDSEAVALLECLAKHLFDPALDTHFITRVCGAQRDVRDRVAAKVGPLKAYISELRMAAAARMVRESEASIPEIGRRVGFLVPRTFRRAFQRVHSVTPSAMRKQARHPQSSGPVASPIDPLADLQLEDDEQLTPGAVVARWRRWTSLGLLDRERATELRCQLRRCYPQLETAPAEPRQAGPRQAGPRQAGPRQAASRQAAPTYDQLPVVLTPTGDHLERFAADIALYNIFGLPEADLRHALLEGVRLGNPAAFYRLHSICAGQVQWDAERAVLVAELAVQLIDRHRELLGNEREQWKAVAWAFLGRIQVIAGRYGDADKALGFAWEEAGDDATLAPWSEIEVRRVAGMLRLRQHRGDEAVRALDRAVELSRSVRCLASQHPVTVLERLELASHLGEAAAGFKLSQELEELVEERGLSEGPNALWLGFVAYHRGKAYAAAGDDRRAEASLRQAAERVSAEDEGEAVDGYTALATFVIHELAHVAYRGRRFDECETLLRAAVEHSRRLHAPVFEAAAETELAVLCALRGRHTEARLLASSSMAFLDDLPFHRQAWHAARTLRALADSGVDLSEAELEEVFSTLRCDLQRVRWEITGSQAVPAARARKARA